MGSRIFNKDEVAKVNLWMKSVLDNHSSGEDTGESNRTSFSAALTGMILFSQKYHSINFPNPDRAECPPPKMLRALIASGKLPGSELRCHLFSCSECFQSYRSSLATHKIQMDAQVTSWWWKVVEALLSPTRRWAFAGAISLALVFLTVGQLMHWPHILFNKQGHASNEVPVENPSSGINLSDVQLPMVPANANSTSPSPSPTPSTKPSPPAMLDVGKGGGSGGMAIFIPL
jgi:hypothetical protein